MSFSKQVFMPAGFGGVIFFTYQGCIAVSMDGTHRQIFLQNYSDLLFNLSWDATFHVDTTDVPYSLTSTGTQQIKPKGIYYFSRNNDGKLDTSLDIDAPNAFFRINHGTLSVANQPDNFIQNCNFTFFNSYSSAGNNISVVGSYLTYLRDFQVMRKVPCELNEY